MSETRRCYTLLLHRDGDTDSRRIRIPVWLGRTLVASSIVLLALLVLAAASYIPLLRLAATVPSMRSEITQLRAENGRILELAAALDSVEAQYRKVRDMLGANVVEARTPGAGLPESPTVAARLPGAAPRYEAIGGSTPSHWPLDRTGYVTRGQLGANPSEEPHRGVDIAIPVGTPVRASGGGVVEEAGTDPQYGVFVRLKHPEGYETMYGHLSRLTVEAGADVLAGQIIGLSGNSGRSSAPHLHFEIIREGTSIDPLTMVREGG